MSTEREQGLAQLREQAGGIDPAVDQALNYAKGVRAVQEVTRQQGQVMSAALANNHELYHTNKKLVRRMREMDAELVQAQREARLAREKLEDERAAWQTEREQLVSAGGDRFRALYESAMRTMTAWLYAELSPDQLKQRLDEMKAQAAEIAAMEHRATPEELEREGVNQPVFGRHAGTPTS